MDGAHNYSKKTAQQQQYIMDDRLPGKVVANNFHLTNTLLEHQI